MRKVSGSAWAGIILLVLSGCSKATTPPVSSQSPHSTGPTIPSSESEWDKRFWITKAARVLRGGQSLPEDEDISSLLPLSKKEIVSRFMADPRFSDALLDFSLYYIGEKKGPVRDLKGNYDSSVYNFPQAISAARGMSNGTSDIFQLWNSRQPLYLLPLQPPYSAQDGSDSDAEKARQAGYQDVLAVIDSLITEASDTQHFDIKNFCADAFKIISDVKNGTQTGIVTLGWDSNLILLYLNDPHFFGTVLGKCSVSALPDMDWVKELKRFKGVSDKLFRVLADFEPSVYPDPKTIDDLKPFDLAAFGVKSNPFNALKFTITNSSTNLDRKRASYVLKRYFCDDLTPIDVETPVTHAGNIHGSDKSCFACHYKLDPMAGFFRNYGYQMTDFSKYPLLVFDDAASTDRPTYERNWKAQKGALNAQGQPLEWNVGYVRSVNDPSLNFYGEDPSYGLDIDGLFKIIQNAPEARSCLVRRMFEYFVKPDQSVDGAYLADVESRFNERAKKNSSEAFKEAVAEFLVSDVFQQRNPKPDQCYDHLPGYDAATALPCKVDYVVKNSCLRCHSAPDQKEGSLKDGLYLNRWIQTVDGKSTFLHLVQGKQVDPEKTFTEITERLSSTDSDIRMPLNTFMENADRLKLYQWADSLAKKYGGHAR